MHVPGAGRRRAGALAGQRRRPADLLQPGGVRPPPPRARRRRPHRLRRRVGEGHARSTSRARPRCRSARLAQEAGGSRRGKNMVAVGLVCGLLGIDTARIEEMILKRYAHKGDVGEANIRSLLRRRRARARRSFPAGAHKLARRRAPERGPRARSRATRRSASARCTRASTTTRATRSRPPRTSSSGSPARLPRFGGVAIQTEDEIAALASVLGASFAGKKAMTATSGPGPVADGGAGRARRHGRDPGGDRRRAALRARRPGMPTKTEQSDLNHALYGGHGEAPRVVMAPTSVEDCFHVIVEAFNAAEQLPGAGDRALGPVAVAPPRDRAPARPRRASRWSTRAAAGRRANGALQALRDPRRRRLADGGPGRPRRLRLDRHRARRGRQPALRAGAARRR